MKDLQFRSHRGREIAKECGKKFFGLMIFRRGEAGTGAGTGAGAINEKPVIKVMGYWNVTGRNSGDTLHLSSTVLLQDEERELMAKKEKREVEEGVEEVEGVEKVGKKLYFSCVWSGAGSKDEKINRAMAGILWDMKDVLSVLGVKEWGEEDSAVNSWLLENWKKLLTKYFVVVRV